MTDSASNTAAPAVAITTAVAHGNLVRALGQLGTDVKDDTRKIVADAVADVVAAGASLTGGVSTDLAAAKAHAETLVDDVKQDLLDLRKKLGGPLAYTIAGLVLVLVGAGLHDIVGFVVGLPIK